MDTGTHLVIGLGLAGLSHIDPVVASNPTLAVAVLIGTIVGSQAPDTDGFLRFRGNAIYIKNHRGASHSIPAVLLWTLAITLLLSLLFSGLPVLHIGLWVFIAVSFHVFTDLFNTYGTQAARPFTEKWISWNIIHIFDPFIFITHLIAIFMWVVHLGEPQQIFPILYLLIACYYVWRTFHHVHLEKRLIRFDSDFHKGDRIYAIPTVSIKVWNIVKRRHDGTFVLGEYRNGNFKWVDRVSCDCHPAIDASRSHPDVAAFLYFSSFACAEIKEMEFGYEVRWADVRYRHRKQYPFIAVLRMDLELRPIYSYVGWVSETRLEKKLGTDPLG